MPGLIARREVEAMHPVLSGTAQIAGADLAYDVWGSGAPVVFIHGTGTHRRTFEPVIHALPAGRAYVAYDRRGFGGSRGSLAEGISRHAEDFAAIVKDALRAPEQAP